MVLNSDHESDIPEKKSARNSRVRNRNSEVNTARAEENTGHKCRTDIETFDIREPCIVIYSHNKTKEMH